MVKSLIEYYEKYNCEYIHPSEKEKEPKVSKRNHNKCKRLYDKEGFIPKRKNQKKKIFPNFPSSGKLTKPLKEMFEKF